MLVNCCYSGFVCITDRKSILVHLVALVKIEQMGADNSKIVCTPCGHLLFMY